MRLVTIGDNVVDRYPQLGLMFPGGNAVNVAVFASRNGADASYIGVLGDDQAGLLVREALDVHGVGAERARTEHGPTAHAMVELHDGDRSFVSSSKGVSMFAPDDGDLALIAAADLVHTGHASGMEDHVSTMARLTPLSFDFSYRHEPAYLDRVMPFVTYAHFSAGHLDDDGVAALARRAATYRPPHLLITRGAAGADYWQQDHRYHQPARPVEVVDTLGAGDAFIASLIVDGPTPQSVTEVLARAADRAAAVCRTNGAFGHPRRLALATAGHHRHSTGEPPEHTQRDGDTS